MLYFITLRHLDHGYKLPLRRFYYAAPSKGVKATAPMIVRGQGSPYLCNDYTYSVCQGDDVESFSSIPARAVAVQTTEYSTEYLYSTSTSTICVDLSLEWVTNSNPYIGYGYGYRYGHGPQARLLCALYLSSIFWPFFFPYGSNESLSFPSGPHRH